MTLFNKNKTFIGFRCFKSKSVVFKDTYYVFVLLISTNLYYKFYIKVKSSYRGKKKDFIFKDFTLNKTLF